MTEYQSHCERWKDGCGAMECSGANKVFARGKIPCDILFIGEAPGEAEDCLKQPFIGPAGKLLDNIIGQTLADKYRIAYYNTVGCIPRDDEGNPTAPDYTQVLTCRPRLQEFLTIAKARLIVAVGSVSQEEMRHYTECPVIEIIHPAAILRATVAQKNLMARRAASILEQGIRTHLEAKSP